MKFRKSRWTMVIVVVIAFLMVGTMVWASAPASGPSGSLQAYDATNADKVDGHHAASSSATKSKRANRVLWAGSNGQLAWKAMPRSALSSRYLNDDRKETIRAAVTQGALLTVDNQGVSGCGLKASGKDKGVRGESLGGTGVAGWSGSGWGVHGFSQSGYGVHGTSGSSGYGVYGFNISGTAVFGLSGYDIGVRGESDNGTGVRGESDNGTGVHARSDSNLPLRVEGAYGNNLFEAWDIVAFPGDLRFKVTRAGAVYADVGYYTPATDFAEMLPAGDGLEPGDVLVIGPDGQLTRSTEPYQASVAGVYSTQPGFVGGSGDDADLSGKVPLAIVGVVPVKVSAENGAIRPGDPLTTSSTPGHAMRCDDAVACIGAIVGKALEPLEEGRGVILVLVTLQ